MNSINEREFSDLVCNKLNELDYEVILSNPTTESKFPCLEIHTPLKSVKKSYNAIPISLDFQISITSWSEKQRNCMDMAQEIDEKMKELNALRTNSNLIVYDSILKKYGFTVIYEVRYNALTNSFEYIR